MAYMDVLSTHGEGLRQSDRSSYNRKIFRSKIVL